MIPLRLILPEIHDYAGFIARDFAAATWRKSAVFRRAYPRKFRLYGVGVGKSGTHSLAAIFSRHHAAHEANFYRTAELSLRIREGESGPEIDRVIRERDERLFLEMESSHLLCELVPALVRLYPEARFILPLREPYAWLESALNQKIRVQHRPLPPAVPKLYAHRTGPVSTAPEEAAIAALGISSLDGLMGYYGKTAHSILAAVPAERLMVIRTQDISKRLPEIATFAGVPVESLKAEAAHQYKGVVKANLLQSIPRPYLKAIVERHAGSLIDRYFPETRAGAAG